MRFTISKDELVTALGPPTRVANTRATSQAVGGVLLDVADKHIVMTGIGDNAAVKTAATLLEASPGKALLPARTFHDLVRALDGDISVRTTGDKATVSAGAFVGAMTVFAPGNFPTFDTPKGNVITLPGATALSQTLAQILPAASRDESRAPLTGVNFRTTDGWLMLAATDAVRVGAKRFAAVDNELQFNATFPREPLAEAARAGVTEITLAEDSSFVVLWAPHFIMKVDAMKGQFPVYEKFIPQQRSMKSLVVPKASLLPALRRVALMGDEWSPARISYDVASLRLVVQVETPSGSGNDVVDDVDADGTPFSRLFNLKYLIDGVEAVRGDRVELLWSADDDRRPIILQGKREDKIQADFTYVLMPVRKIEPKGAKT